MKNTTQNCIILNKPFLGEWLKQDDNIAHEIINFFRADDGNIYIYNMPYGANVSKNLTIKYLYLTTSTEKGIYFLEYCIKIKQSLHSQTISRSDQENDDLKKQKKLSKIIEDGKKEIVKNIGKDINGVKYDKISINDLFNDDIKVLPFTFIASNIYEAKTSIPIKEKSEGNYSDYHLGRNYGCVIESEHPEAYNCLSDKGPDISSELWRDITSEIKPFKRLDQNESNNKKLKSLEQNLFLDLIDNFKMEECYTKIIFKLMESDAGFINSLMKEIFNKDISGTFKPKPEHSISKVGRIDLFAESEEQLLIIENKVDSRITIDDKGVSQLKRYYDWASKQHKECFYVIFAPDYRTEAVEAEEKGFREKEGFKKYKVCSYSVIRNVFLERKEKKSFKNFKYESYLDDIDLLFLRLSLDRKTLYTAKITKNHP